MAKKIVPEDFKIPKKLETDKFRLRILTIQDIDKDYDAVMSSEKHLLETKPFGPEDTWPTGLTKEQNLIDLAWHQKEFQKRNSFAYTVMNLDESECLGCVYVYPSPNEKYDALVILWVRESRKGLDNELYEKVRQWIKEKWPFNNVAYPGRETDWEEFA